MGERSRAKNETGAESSTAPARSANVSRVVTSSCVEPIGEATPAKDLVPEQPAGPPDGQVVANTGNSCTI